MMMVIFQQCSDEGSERISNPNQRALWEKNITIRSALISKHEINTEGGVPMLC